LAFDDDRNRGIRFGSKECREAVSEVIIENWAQPKGWLSGTVMRMKSVGGVLEHMLRAHCTSVVFDYLHKKATHRSARFRFSFPFGYWIFNAL